MQKLPELHLVRGPANLYAVGRSWPLQHAWRDLVLSLMTKPTP
jgi:hypothetical protein